MSNYLSILVVAKRKPRYIIIILLIIIFIIIVSMINGNGLTAIISLAAAIILYLARKKIEEAVTAYTWASLVSITDGREILLLSGLAMLILGLLHEPDIQEERIVSETKRLIIIPVLFLPLILVYPFTLIPALTLALGATIAWGRASSQLSKVDTVIESKSLTAEYGSSVAIPVLIRTRGEEIFYEIILDEERYRFGRGKGNIVEELVVTPRFLGEETHEVKVILSDEKMRVIIEEPAATIIIRTVLRTFRNIARLRTILYRAAMRILEPLMYEAKLYPEEPPPSAAGGGPGRRGGGVGRGGSGSGIGGVGTGPGEAGGLGYEGLEESGEEIVGRLLLQLVPVKGWEAGFSPYSSIKGEYSGVREYRPGDRIRDIHWKKTVARQELIVKVYEPGSGGGGGAKSLVVIADWVSRNPGELDDLVKKTYSAILSSVGEKIVFLRMPNGRMFLLAGNPLELLNGIDRIVRREGLSLQADYGGWRIVRPDRFAREIEASPGFLRSLAVYYRAVGEAIVEAVTAMGASRATPFITIHSNATALRNYYISQVFREHQFEQGRTDVREWEEIIAEIRRTIARVA